MKKLDITLYESKYIIFKFLCIPLLIIYSIIIMLNVEHTHILFAIALLGIIISMLLLYDTINILNNSFYLKLRKTKTRVYMFLLINNYKKKLIDYDIKSKLNFNKDKKTIVSFQNNESKYVINKELVEKYNISNRNLYKIFNFLNN